MGQPLTWRNVDAPDFRGSMEGLRIAAGSLDRAFTGLGAGLDKYQAYRTEQADNGAMTNAMRINDPAAYREALANGTILQGVDPSLVSARTLQSLDNRSGQLLDRAATQQTVDFNTQANPERIAALGLGNDVTRQNLAHRGVMNPLAEEQARLGNAGQGIANQRASVGLESDNLGLERGRFNFGNERTAEADRQAALPLVERLRTQVDQDGAYGVLNSPEFQRLSPQARAQVMNAAQGIPGLSGLFGAAGSAPAAGGAGGASPASSALASAAGGSAGTGAPGTRGGSAADATYGFRPTATPLSSQPVSQVLEHQSGMRQAPGGHTPVGAFQFTQDTLRDLAPRVLGADWQNQPFSFENQDRLARALFEERRSGNLSQTWAALPDRGVGGYANVPWEQVRGQIMRAELGNNISIPQLRTEATTGRVQAGQATAAIAATQNENRAQGLPRYAAALQDTTSTEMDIAKKLQQSTYADLPLGRLTQNIQDLRAQYPGMTAAAAGVILENSISPSGRVMRNLPTWIGGGQGTPDMDQAATLARGMARGDVGRAVEQDSQMSGTSAAVTAAQQAHETAAATLAAAVQRGPMAADQLPRLQANLAQRRATLDAALQRQSGDNTLNPSYNRTQPGAGPQQPANIPGAEPFARVDTDHPTVPVTPAARPGPTTQAAQQLQQAARPEETRPDAPVNQVDQMLRQATADRQAAAAQDDQARALRATTARNAIVNSALLDARELLNSGISPAEAARMAVTSSAMRGKGITAEEIEAALRRR